jgi:hypothetical protein
MALYSVTSAVDHIDDNIIGVGWGFRFLIFWGCLIFWPLILYRRLKHITVE